MCIILFNKKIKLNQLDDVMSTKVNKNIKGETKISIPDNFVALVYYKDCYLFSLNTGEYKLESDDFKKVIKRNERKNRKRKKSLYSFNIHYINITSQSLVLEFKSITSFKNKKKYYLNASYYISNPKSFANELLITWYKTTNNRTIAYINSWFKEFFENAFRKRDKISFSNNELLREYANKYFKKFGITIQSISISPEQTKTFTTEQPNVIKEVNLNQENYTINKVEPKSYYCNKCQAKIISNSAFCVRCGEKININNITFK